jgi:hypothetical protein
MLSHIYHWIVYAWLWYHAWLCPHGQPSVQRAGFIIAIIGAVIGIITTVAQYVIDLGGLAFSSIESAVRFAVRGVGWLTGVLRSGFGDLVDGLGNVFGSIGDWLKNLYQDYQDFKDKLSDWFGPVIDFLKKVRQWYDLVWKKVVQPVLNILQRFRKVLAIFKFFHLKWAQQLDSDIAMIEGKIAQNFLRVRNYLNLATSWLQFVVDPLGALRRFPLLAGIFNNLNLLWAGIFGSPFNWGGGAGTSGPTAHISTSLSNDVTALQVGAGPLAPIVTNSDGVRSRVFAEMGINQ